MYPTVFHILVQPDGSAAHNLRPVSTLSASVRFNVSALCSRAKYNAVEVAEVNGRIAHLTFMPETFMSLKPRPFLVV